MSVAHNNNKFNFNEISQIRAQNVENQKKVQKVINT